MQLDILTLSAVLVLAGFIQAGVLIIQYRSNPKFNGIGWWVSGSICTALGFTLNTLRSHPAWLPWAVILGNSLYILAQIFIFVGIQRFFGHKHSLGRLLTVGLLYSAALIYYFVQDNLVIRVAIISFTVSLFLFANAMLLFRNRKQIGRDSLVLTAGAFFGLACIFILRLIFILAKHDTYGGYFTPSTFQLLTLFGVFAAGNLWTFGLILMINQRLNLETKETQERFEVLFHTGPDAALLTRLDDGMIVEVNEGFSNLFGYQAEEVLGKTSLGLNLWKRREDRRNVTELLIRKLACENLEITFLAKDGRELTTMYSAKIVHLSDVPFMISVIRDITRRKQEEEKIRQSEALHRSILSASPDGIIITTLDGIILKASPKIAGIFGVENEADIIGKNHLQFVVEQDRSRVIENIELLFHGASNGPGEYRIQNSEGRTISVESNAEFVRDELGQPINIVYIVRDIQERKHLEAIMQKNSRVQLILGKIAEEALRDYPLHEFYAKVRLWVQKILPADAFSIIIVDESTDEVKVSYCTGEQIALPAVRKTGKGLTEYVIRHGMPVLLDPEEFQRLKAAGEIDLEFGNVAHQWLGAPLTDIRGRAFGIVVLNLHDPDKYFREEDTGVMAIIASQISLAIGRRKLEDELKRLAMTDELTGIANRRHFMHKAEEEFRRIKRYPSSAALLMMDLDHFKKVNDVYGHAMGDQVLRIASRTGKRMLRETDQIGRIGGEEFCLLLPETGLDDAYRIAERLRKEIASIIFQAENGTTFSVTVSIGIAAAESSDQTLSEWLNRADNALYKAKAEGRNRSEIHSL